LGGASLQGSFDASAVEQASLHQLAIEQEGSGEWQAALQYGGDVFLCSSLRTP
jgi:hypothetical protein